MLSFLMPKKNTKHPVMKMVKVIFPDGRSIEVNMSTGYEKEELHVQAYPKSMSDKGKASAAELRSLRDEQLRKKFPQFDI